MVHCGWFRSLSRSIYQKTTSVKSRSSARPMIQHHNVDITSLREVSQHCVSQSSLISRPSRFDKISTDSHRTVSHSCLFFQVISPARYLHSKSAKSVDVKTLELGGNRKEDDSPGWMLRLANENGYLSWCRNCYIGTVVAINVYMQDAVVVYAKEAAFIFMVLCGSQITVGTLLFIYNMMKLRRRMFLSGGAAVFMSALACFHLVLWLSGVAIYMGFVEEELPQIQPEDEPLE